jgi:hypothetical protein
MKCIICNNNSNYYFSKNYLNTLYKSFVEEIGDIDYYKCENCGFTISKTHMDLENSKWNEINFLFHEHWDKNKGNYIVNAPPYIEQALMINILFKNDLIDVNNIVDYAAGYGTLSKVLNKYFDLKLSIYDEYINTNDERYISKEDLGKYNTVINSAMFEHILIVKI